MIPSARRGGTETFWRVWGKGPTQALLLHCSLAHSGAWNGLAPLLGATCVAPDLPGHGRSGPLDSSGDFQAQSVAMAGDLLTEAPIDVIGHSFGATVALRLALEQPERVRRLVLIEPVFFAAARGTPAYDAHVAEFQPFVQALEAGEPMQAARLFTEMWGSEGDWDTMRDGQRASLTQQVGIIPAQDVAIFGDNAGQLRPGRLEALNIPVLLLEGARTMPIIRAIHPALAARLPDAQRQVIEGAGHMAPISHPVESAKAIDAFFEYRTM